MNRIISACLLAAGLSFVPMARAATLPGGVTLFERSLVVDRSTNIFTTPNFNLRFIFGDSFLSPTNPVKLFDGTGVTPGDVGHVYVSDPSDPAFAAVAGRLTDGRDDVVRLMFTETVSGRAEQRGWRESGFFVGHGSNEIPDLKGAVIQALKLRIDGFSLAPSGAAASALSGPPVDVQMTFTVVGSYVPEPSSLALGALAMLAASAYTGRRSSGASA